MDSQQAGPHPPFRVAWESEPLTDHVIRDGVAYAGANGWGGSGGMWGKALAIALATGAVLWRRRFTQEVVTVDAVLEEGVFVSVGRVSLRGPGRRDFLVLDRATGTTLGRAPGGDRWPFVVGGQFALVHEGPVLQSVDPLTQRVRWSLRLDLGSDLFWEQLAQPACARGEGSRPAFVSASCLAPGNRLLLGTSIGSVLCIDARLGALLWRQEIAPQAPYPGPDAPSSPVGRVSIESLSADAEQLYASNWSEFVDESLDRVGATASVVAMRADTGAVAWRSRLPIEMTREAALAGDLLVLPTRYGGLIALSRADGTVRWQQRLSHAQEPRISSPRCSGDTLYVAAHDDDPAGPAGARLFALGLDGERLWSYSLGWDLGGWPPEPLPDGFLVRGRNGSLVRLTMGEPAAASAPGPAAEREAKARSLLPRLRALTPGDRETLLSLGQDAVRVLLPFARETCARQEGLFRRMSAMGAAYRDGGLGVSYAQFSLRYAQILLSYPQVLKLFMERSRARDTFAGALEILSLLALPADVPELMRLLLRDEGPPRETFERLVAKGDDAALVPLFIEAMQGTDAQGDPPFLALNALARSSDPRAVQYLIERLQDPDADSRTRTQAFAGLANTGGEAGLRAVLAARERDRTIPSLAAAMRLDQLGPEPPKRLRWLPAWAYEADVLDPSRHPTRLLDARADRHGVRWGLVASPVLGSTDDLWIVRREGSRWVEPLFTGITGKELGQGDWFGRFVGNPDLSRDSDGDGWTDLVEQRLGTDPDCADTDGDGLSDSQDKNPLAARRPETDEEKVLAAAFEAEYRFGQPGGPILVEFPPGIEPFELFGPAWVILGVAEGVRPPLADSVGVVSFHLPRSRADGTPVEQHHPDAGPVVWSQGGTEASVGIGWYRGPLAASSHDVYLRKLGEEWVVVGSGQRSRS